MYKYFFLIFILFIINNGYAEDNKKYIALPDKYNNFLWKTDGNNIFLEKGNLGIGLYNSKIHNWNRKSNVIQLQGNQAIAGYSNHGSGPGGTLWLTQNAYFSDKPFQWLYQSDGPASMYLQTQGNHYFRVVDKNKKNNIINWNYVFNIKNNGKVGIGTMNPSSLLQVGGNVDGKINVVSDAGKIVTLDPTDLGPYVGTTTNHDFRITANSKNIIYLAATNENVGIGSKNWNSSYPEHKLEIWGDFLVGNDSFTVTNSGNVGIGTENPKFNLHILSESLEPTLFIESKAVESYPSIRLKNDKQQWNIYNNGSMNNNFDIYDWTAGLHRFVIDTKGNIGIGTVEPKKKLHVKGQIISESSAPGIFIKRTDGSGPEDELAIGQYGNRSFIQYPVSGVNNVKQNEGGLIFIKRGTQADISNPPLFLASNGNVGIGTANPQDDLHVIGDIRVYNNNSYNRLDWNGLTSTSYLYLQTEVGGNDIVFRPLTSEKVRITTTGNMGIGTSNPQTKLEVKGTIKADNLIVNDINIFDLLNKNIDNTDIDKFMISNNFPEKRENYFTITPDGKVGIGTSKPTKKFHIFSGSSGGVNSHPYSIMNLEHNNHMALQFMSPNTTDQYIFFGDPEDNMAGQLYYNHTLDIMGIHAGSTTIAWFNSGGLGIGTSSDFNDSLAVAGKVNIAGKLTVNNTIAVKDKIGIGTSSPGSELEIKSNQVPELRMVSSDNTKHSKITFYNKNKQTGVIQGMPSNSMYGYERSNDMEYLVNYGDHNFWNQSSSLMTIKNNGNIGVGTTNPSFKFQLGDLDYTYQAGAFGIKPKKLKSGRKNIFRIEHPFSNTHLFHISYDYDKNSSYIGFKSDPDKPENITISEKTGNVGIFDYNPNSTLSVNGSLALKIKTISQDYTLTENDNVILVDNKKYIEIKLPSAKNIEGRIYTIKKINSNNHSIAVIPFGNEKIDNYKVYNLLMSYETLKIISDNNQWYILK